MVDADGHLVGCITDGDLRRGLEGGNHLLDLPAEAVMNREPKRILRRDLAVSALATMEGFEITSLFVMEDDESWQPVGVIHIHDIFKSGIRR